MNLTEEMHSATDHAMYNSGVYRATCCSKCTTPHCCDEPAYGDQREVRGMLDALNEEQREYVKEKTKVWLDKAMKSGLLFHDLPSAFHWRLHGITCPFLRDGRCLAYARRPHGCRVFFAFGNPDDCGMPQRKNQKIAEFRGPAIDRILGPYFEQMSEEPGGVDMDHIGVLLSFELLNVRPPSASKRSKTNERD